MKNNSKRIINVILIISLILPFADTLAITTANESTILNNETTIVYNDPFSQMYDSEMLYDEQMMAKFRSDWIEWEKVEVVSPLENSAALSGDQEFSIVGANGLNTQNGIGRSLTPDIADVISGESEEVRYAELLKDSLLHDRYIVKYKATSNISIDNVNGLTV